MILPNELYITCKFNLKEADLMAFLCIQFKLRLRTQKLINQSSFQLITRMVIIKYKIRI